MQRLLAPHGGPAVQRWAVTLPAGTTDGQKVLDHMAKSSPYAQTGAWARTFVKLDWGGDPVFATSGGTTTATVKNPTVTRSARVDMPTWAPTDATMASAWAKAMTELRTHETEHEKVATTWETTLRSRLTALSVTLPKQDLAEFKKAVQASWDAWLIEHQADQTALDPYTVTLDMSGGDG
ncbi:MAG: DUF922 domain-containing protein [Chloroflexota bacterium]